MTLNHPSSGHITLKKESEMCMENQLLGKKQSYMWMNTRWLLSLVTSYAQLQSSAAFLASLRWMYMSHAFAQSMYLFMVISDM